MERSSVFCFCREVRCGSREKEVENGELCGFWDRLRERCGVVVVGVGVGTGLVGDCGSVG